MSSADLTCTFPYAVFLWEKLCFFSILCNHTEASFIPSGTHYCWVNRGTKREVCLSSLQITRAASSTKCQSTHPGTHKKSLFKGMNNKSTQRAHRSPTRQLITPILPGFAIWRVSMVIQIIPKILSIVPYITAEQS